MARRKHEGQTQIVSRNPYLMQEETLEGFEVVLTDSEKMDVFMSKFISSFGAYGKHREYIERHSEPEKVIFSKIRSLYSTYIISEGWSEKKYATVIDRIMANYAPLTKSTISHYGLMYERMGDR